MEYQLNFKKSLKGWLHIEGQLEFNKYPCDLQVELVSDEGKIKRRRLLFTLRGKINFILKTQFPVKKIKIKSENHFVVHSLKVREISYLEALYRAYRRVLPVLLSQDYATRDLRKRLNLKIKNYIFDPFTSYYKISFARVKRICSQISISKWLSFHHQILSKFVNTIIENKDLPSFDILIFDEDTENLFGDTKKSLKVQSYSHYQFYKTTINKISYDNLKSFLKGDWTLILYAGDTLNPKALEILAKFIKRYSKVNNKEVNLYYFDSYFVDLQTNELKVNLKPDFSLEYFKHYNYILNAFIIKTSILLNLIEGKPISLNQFCYDLILKFLQKYGKESIYHIHFVLMKHGILSLKKESFLNIETKAGKLEKSPYFNPPLVSIIIPTKDNVNLLKNCLQSILNKTTYPKYEIIIVDNSSEEKETFKFYENLKKLKNIHIINSQIRNFNFSSLINYGIKHAKGEVICLLNNDTEVISPNWIEEMLYYVLKPEVGVVGAKLFYEDRTVQHAGVIVGLWGLADHIFKRASEGEDYMNRLLVPQEYLAVTAACMMFRKEVFFDVGGFDESLAVNFNDLDFCLRVYERGYKIIYTPFSQLFHFEHKTRGKPITPEKIRQLNKEKKIIIQRWKKYIEYDPYFNLNFSLNSTKLDFDFSGRVLKYYLKSFL